MAEIAAQDGTDAGRQNAVPSRYITDPDEVTQVLKLLRDQRADLQLRFDEENAVYQAKVLDLQGASVLIEDIHPREGMKLLRAGRPFSLSARTDGLYVHSAHNKAHKADSERSIPFFHVALPKNLLWQQRRRAMRYRLPLRVTIAGAQVTLFPKGKDTKPLSGTIIDISAGGCRAEFMGFKFRPIQEGDPLQSCALQVPKLLEFNTQAEIRHSSFDMRRRLLTCGIEFTEMHVTDRRRLEQFIQTMSRGLQSG
jgi:c-di-GMP-binding flagellar brake protein YcgR